MEQNILVLQYLYISCKMPEILCCQIYLHCRTNVVLHYWSKCFHISIYFYLQLWRWRIPSWSSPSVIEVRGLNRCLYKGDKTIFLCLFLPLKCSYNKMFSITLLSWSFFPKQLIDVRVFSRAGEPRWQQWRWCRDHHQEETDWSWLKAGRC